MRAVVFALGAVLVATLTGCSDDDDKKDDKKDDNDDQGAKFDCQGISWEWECNAGKVELETKCGSTMAACQTAVAANQALFGATSSIIGFQVCDQDGDLEITVNMTCDVTASEECNIFSDDALWKVCENATASMAVV